MMEPGLILIPILLVANPLLLQAAATTRCEHGEPSWPQGPCLLSLCEYAAVVVRVDPYSWKTIGIGPKVEARYRERLASTLLQAGLLVDTDPRPPTAHYCVEGAQLWLTLTAREPDPPAEGVLAWSTQLEVREYGSLERAKEDRSFVVTWLAVDFGATTRSNVDSALSDSVDRLATRLFWMHVGYLSGQRPHGACGPLRQ
jgi:hypothetical protein